LVPIIVTLVPTGPMLGVKLEIVGAAHAVDAEIAKIRQRMIRQLRILCQNALVADARSFAAMPSPFSVPFDMAHEYGSPIKLETRHG